MPDTIPLSDQIAEVLYELSQRKRVYPKLQYATPATLERHMQRMEAVLHTLQRLAAQEAAYHTPSLFSEEVR